MSSKTKAIVSALAMMIAAPVPAWAFGAGAGCADLPDYARAQGVLEGIPSGCDMSIERARQIVAAQDGPAAVYGAAPAPRVHHRRHRRAVPRN